MKMIMPLKAADAGTVSPKMAAGSVIEADDLLLVSELDDPSKARSITPFQGDSLGLEEASAVKQDALLTYRSIFDQLAQRWTATTRSARTLWTPSGSSSKRLVIRTSSASRSARSRAIGQKMPAELDAALAKVAATIDVAGLESELAAYENEPAVQSLEGFGGAVVRRRRGCRGCGC